MKLKTPVRLAFLSAVLFWVAGCSSLVSNVTQSFAQDLANAILDNPDLEMVRDGAPSYLILIDSLVARSPEDAFLLGQSATLHSAYAAAFVEDEARAKLLHSKAKAQALASVCVQLKDACELETRPFKAFASWVEARSAKDVPAMYTLAAAWSSWIQAHSDDFTAIADLARVKALMQRCEVLDPTYDNGGVYLYLGVFETLLPPAMGGKPEVGRGHFEAAIEQSGGDNLMAKMMFAELYARLVFDRELHDDLLGQVDRAPAQVPGLTLMNTVAKERAAQLMETADEYF